MNMKIKNTTKYKNVFKERCLTCPQVRYTRFSQQLEVVCELQTSAPVDLTDQKSSIQRFGLVRP
jgi:hypothetical protein